MESQLLEEKRSFGNKLENLLLVTMVSSFHVEHESNNSIITLDLNNMNEAKIIVRASKGP